MVIPQAVDFLRQYLGEGMLGYSSLFIAMILQVILPILPAELIVIAGSKIYGVWITTLIAGTGLWIGSLAVYYIGKFLRGRFSKFFGRKKIKLAMERLSEHEDLILWIRILPYNPADVISYAAGIIELDIKKFTWITGVVSFVRVAILALMGQQLKDASTLLSILGFFVVSAAIAYAILAKRKGKGWKESLKEYKNS